MATASVQSAPLGDINTTPLIDVMLVLLVMMVLSVPAATNSLDVELPNCGTSCGDIPPDATRNRIVVTAGDAILWNGHEVTAQTLNGLLAETRRFAVEPELQFEPDPAASYNATAHVIHVIKASGVTKFGFVGNERFRDLAA